MGQKPDDWNTVSLCDACHRAQHQMGEESFWKGVDVNDLVELFIRVSPKRDEINRIRKERESDSYST